MAPRIPETDRAVGVFARELHATESEFALEVVDAVVEAWDPSHASQDDRQSSGHRRVSMPNVYADQIEWMGRHIARRAS